MLQLYEDDLLTLSDDGIGKLEPSFDSELFNDAAKMVYEKGGFSASMLADPRAKKVLSETAKNINSAIETSVPHEVPDTLRYALENNGFIFSGFKTFHALREVGLSMLDDKGNVKPYADFQKDVQQINDNYNTNWLSAEYKHALGASLMAVKWNDLKQDSDRYFLQYRTAQDSRVRPDHAALDGITLPADDPFWDKYYPPNGWGCRCQAVQVRRSKYQPSDPKASMRLGDNATDTLKQRMFRYNAGKDMKLFPPKHPYYKVPETAKNVINNSARDELGKQLQKDLTSWYKNNLPETKVGKFTAKRFEVAPQGEDKKVVINKTFYNEVINKHKEDELYPMLLIKAKQAHRLLPLASLVRTEQPNSLHPDAVFKVYTYEDSDYHYEFKVKSNHDADILFIMRIYKK